MGSIDGTSLLSMVILLFLSAFFSSTETAFSSVNMLRLRGMVEDGNKRAKTAIKLLTHFDKLLATILVGNNIVNIALSSIATVMATNAFGPGAVAITTGIVTFLVLTFGEIMPKSFGKEKSEFLVLNTAKILDVLCTVLTPVTIFFLWLRKVLSKGNEAEKQPTITEQELMYMLDTIEEEGVLEEEEKDLVQSALEFDETTVQEILTPRVNVVALDINDTSEKILDTLRTERFSRLPVYRDSIDNIVGWVHATDIYDWALDGKTISLKKLIKPVMYIHRTKKISILLSEFQKKKVHFAVVIDDYGGTLGIVTMEDLLEELVGEIWDEDDEIINSCQKLSENVYRVSGDLSIYEFLEKIDYEPHNFDPDYNTINGWVMEKLEHIPEAGESFVDDIATVKVLEVEDQFVTKAEVTINKPEEEEE